MKEGEIPIMTTRFLACLSLRQGVIQNNKAYRVMEGSTCLQGDGATHECQFWTFSTLFLGYVIKYLSIPISFSFSKKSLQNFFTYLPSPQTLPYPNFFPFPNFWKSLYLGFFTTLWYIPKLNLMLSGFLTVQSITSWIYRCCYKEFCIFSDHSFSVMFHSSTFSWSKLVFVKVVSLRDTFHFKTAIITLMQQNHFSELQV